MTRSDDEILHEALHSDAGTAIPPAGGFDEVPRLRREKDTGVVLS